MLSPKRATFSRCASAQPQAARVQVPIRSTTAGSLQCPTTVLRRRPILVSMKPNSRSPCADWFRFMKSMSISAHGRSRLNCVCRCRSGLCSAFSPPIHIFAGEKVCIHATTPTQLSAAFASRQSFRIDSGLLTTGRCSTRTGIAPSASSEPAISRACSSTWRSTSSP